MSKIHTFDELRDLVNEALFPPKKSNSNYNQTPILIYKDGIFITEVYSLREAEAITGVDNGQISRYLRGIVQSAKGWDFQCRTQQA